jgi:RNase adaptor protein for sRNA GlmZ degradation
MNIPIEPYAINLSATSIQVQIDDFQFGSHITIKLMFFDANNNYLISKYVKLEGQDYLDMTTSQNSDIFIKNFVQSQLNLTLLLG